jgi:hypothetical protein
MVFR